MLFLRNKELIHFLLNFERYRVKFIFMYLFPNFQNRVTRFFVVVCLALVKILQSSTKNFSQAWVAFHAKIQTQKLKQS